MSSKRGAVLLPGEGGISGTLSRVSMEKRAESEEGYCDILPSTNKAGSPRLPDPNTLGATPTAPQYLYVGASTSATNFPIGLLSSYKVNPRNQQEFAAHGTKRFKPWTSYSNASWDQDGFGGQVGPGSNSNFPHSLGCDPELVTYLLRVTYTLWTSVSSSVKVG